MSWIDIMFLVLYLCLVFETFVVFRRIDKVPLKRWLGFFTLFLVISLPLLAVVSSRSLLINSPEFGVIMAQGGPFARFGLALLVLCIAPAVGMAWSIARLEAGYAPRTHWLCTIGLCVGLAGVVRICLLQPINPNDLKSLQVQYYDLWWPPTFIWLSVCLVGIITALLRFPDSLSRLCPTILLVAALTLHVLNRPEFADSTSSVFWGNTHPLGSWARLFHEVWTASLGIELLLGAALLIWAFVTSPKIPQSRLRRRISFILSAMPFVMGLFVLWCFHLPRAESALFWIADFWPLWIVWALLCLSLLLRRDLLPWRSAAAHWAEGLKLRHVILLVSYGTLAISLGYFPYFRVNDPVIHITGFVFAWVLLIEIVAVNGPLARLYDQGRTSGIGAVVSTLMGEVALLWTFLAKSRPWFVQVTKALARVSPWPVLVVKTLIGILILIALFEIPNTGKTIIEPFKGAPGMSNDAGFGKDFGQLVSESLLDAIGDMSQALRPDVTPLLTSDSTKAKPEFMVVAGDAQAGIDAALGKSGDIEIGSVKIPLSLIVAPVQARARTLLGVRVVNGSFHEDQLFFTLLARCSDGRTFKAEMPKTDWEQCEPVDSLHKLAGNLGFLIMSSNPSLAAAGMTRSWPAFQEFRFGLEKWRKFESNTSDYASLTEAIAHFRAATQVDPKFSLAQYRLGLVLSADGQPSSAIEAFRNCVQVNPGFVAGQIALGEVLSGFKSPVYKREAAASLPEQGQWVSAIGRREEARRIFQHLVEYKGRAISDSDRARIFYYLALLSSGDPPYLLYFLARKAGQLYAGLPETLRSLPGIREMEAYTQYMIGLAIEREGLENPAFDDRLKPEDWHCSPESLGTEALDTKVLVRLRPLLREVGKQPSLIRNRLAASALPYYDRAARLVPDDQGIACSAATAAYQVGDRRRMDNLDERADAHVYLANRYLDSAGDDGEEVPEYVEAQWRLEQMQIHLKDTALMESALSHADTPGERRVPGDKEAQERLEQARKRQTTFLESTLYHHLALKELETAIDHEPRSVDALNNYGYAFWRWRLKWPERFPFGPDASIAANAERYARRAISVAEEKADPVVLPMVLSTLGEVLLAQGRTEEGLEILGKAVRIAPEHPSFDEIRWDFAQACLWESHNRRQTNVLTGDGRELVETAVEKLRLIRKHDEGREDKLFLSDERSAVWLDPGRLLLVGSHDNGFSIDPLPDPGKSLYVLAKGMPKYERTCNWFGIVAECEGGEAMQTLRLHVWGGGVDQHVDMGKGPSYVFLGYKAQTTRRYYYAQLEQSRDSEGESEWLPEWEPVSTAYPIPTYASEGPDTCAKSGVHLLFVRQKWVNSTSTAPHDR